MNLSEQLPLIAERLAALNAFVAESTPLASSDTYTLHLGYAFAGDGSVVHRCVLSQGSDSVPDAWQHRFEHPFPTIEQAASNTAQTLLEFTQLRIMWLKYRTDLTAEISRICGSLPGVEISTLPDGPALTLNTPHGVKALDAARTLDAWRRTPARSGLSALTKAVEPWNGTVAADPELASTTTASTRRSRCR